MKAKLKIAETPSGYRCQVCGRRFRTEEAAFVHQSYDCSRDVVLAHLIPGQPGQKNHPHKSSLTGGNGDQHAKT
jgi:hypothetical protein